MDSEPQLRIGIKFGSKDPILLDVMSLIEPFSLFNNKNTLILHNHKTGHCFFVG
jgi:hypothetical protein